MNSREYNAFVSSTDQYADRPNDQRHIIALFGLVGEIGSVVSAVKKKLLAEDGQAEWNRPNTEIREELGDAFWYCFSLTQTRNADYLDILSHDIQNLRVEIGGSNDRARRISAALHPEEKEEFLLESVTFPGNGECSFGAYQALAYKTARTDGKALLNVCLAVLWQLGAELLRKTLPDVEIELNKNIADRPVNTILGEVMWHLSAIASVYDLSLDAVIQSNLEKVSFRRVVGTPTPLHDVDRPVEQQLPRRFEISFAQVSSNRSRMYFQGKQLGNDLTDNSYDDDGYRFHDVLHLALIAHLGWSPVFRGFMRKKRPDIDDVEDGGRAKVVEELVLKAIHSEGERQANETGRCAVSGPIQLFTTRASITFELLKRLRAYVEGLEVSKNSYWEWENMIIDGFRMFQALREHRQGLITVDLDSRTIEFSEFSCPRIRGVVAGLGMGTAAHEPAPDRCLTAKELAWARQPNVVARVAAAKRAIREALGGSEQICDHDFEVKFLEQGAIGVRMSDSALKEACRLGVIDFRVAFTDTSEATVCTATALADFMPLTG